MDYYINRLFGLSDIYVGFDNFILHKIEGITVYTLSFKGIYNYSQMWELQSYLPKKPEI